ncbi:MAG: hypothetical protein K6G64_06660 [Eubacterium sp.]|nr:hypothetical protein [Eubacterium sp.]
MNETKNEIIAELDGNISDEQLKLIKSLLDEEKYRMAFLELSKIKESSEVKVSQKYLNLLEKFWWEYAN